MPDQEIAKRVAEDNVKFLEMQFTDIFGTLKAVTIPSSKLEDILKHGKWFDGSSIEGFARIYESDMFLKPDLSSYVLLPFQNGDNATARLFCDVYLPTGQVFEGHPRQVLKRTLQEAKEKGFPKYNVSPELEFFLFNEDKGLSPSPHDSSGYFDAGTKDTASVIKKEIMRLMEKTGIEAEMSHHEVAPGQHEIGFKYGDALAIADNTLLFKQIVKSVSRQHGLYATFMPKPIYGINGSGMHTHFSLADEEGKNLFYDETDSYKLSTLGKQFIAGVLASAQEISVILNPSVNSYKRLVSGYEAPVYVCWARFNRSALIRVPGGIDQKSARAEIRSPDSSCSPHLAFAALLKAGLKGIEEKKNPPEPVEENVYQYDDQKLKEKGIVTLPESLAQAIKKGERSALVKELLGENLAARYFSAKLKEWNEFKSHVTDWEIKRYLRQV